MNNKLETAVIKFLTAEEAISFLAFEIKKLNRLQRLAKMSLIDARHEMELQTDYVASKQGGFGLDDCKELYEFDGRSYNDDLPY